MQAVPVHNLGIARVVVDVDCRPAGLLSCEAEDPATAVIAGGFGDPARREFHRDRPIASVKSALPAGGGWGAPASKRRDAKTGSKFAPRHGVILQINRTGILITNQASSMQTLAEDIKTRDLATPLSQNKHLRRWVEKMAQLTKPAAIHWVDGSQEEIRRALRADGGRPARSSSSTRTFGRAAITPGRTRTMWRAWKTAPSSARFRATPPGPPTTGSTPSKCGKKLKGLFADRCTAARCTCCRSAWAPSIRRMAQIGVQLTDSPYVVVNMRIMARIGLPVFHEIDKDHEARGAVHAYGGRAARTPARWMCRGPATKRNTSCIFRKRARSGRMARATAATRCWARNASRCASRRTSRATKAGWPSTC